MTFGLIGQLQAWPFTIATTSRLWLYGAYLGNGLGCSDGLSCSNEFPQISGGMSSPKQIRAGPAISDVAFSGPCKHWHIKAEIVVGKALVVGIVHRSDFQAPIDTHIPKQIVGLSVVELSYVLLKFEILPVSPLLDDFDVAAVAFRIIVGRMA